MDKKTEALKLAQRITDYLAGGGLFNPELADHGAVRDLLIDCREALAEQPRGEATLAQQQEPVATVTSETGADISMSWWHEPALPVGTKLYTSPQPSKPWVGLTDTEKYALTDDVARKGVPVFEAICEAEAKLREKNTGEQK